MFFDRPASKMMAKQTIGSVRPSPVLVTLVFILLTTGVSTLINFFISNPFTEAMIYIARGYDPFDVYAAFFGGGLAAMGIFVSILLTLYSAIMNFGYARYALRLSRHQEGGFSDLLEGFNLAVKVVLLDVVMGILITLWTMLFIIPGFIAIYRYSQAVNCLLDNPEIGVMEAIRRSKAIMRGQKFNLFILEFSFFGWYLLVAVASNLVGYLLGYPGSVLGTLAQTVVSSAFALWLTPYTAIVAADFYNHLVGWREGPPAGERGYQGPELEF